MDPSVQILCKDYIDSKVHTCQLVSAKERKSPGWPWTLSSPRNQIIRTIHHETSLWI